MKTRPAAISAALAFAIGALMLPAASMAADPQPSPTFVPCTAYNISEITAYNVDCKLVRKWIDLPKAGYGLVAGRNYAKWVGPGEQSGFIPPLPADPTSNGLSRQYY